MLILIVSLAIITFTFAMNAYAYYHYMLLREERIQRPKWEKAFLTMFLTNVSTATYFIILFAYIK